MKLDISSNSIQGELPANGIVNFTKLLHLDMRENSFNESIPTKLFRLQRLQNLDMSSNMFNGILSQEVGALRNLRNLSKLVTLQLDSNLLLDVSSNRLSGEVPVNFALGTKILALDQNEFSGPLPQNLSSLSELKHLDLHNNNITGELPEFLYQMSSLQVLNLRNNSLEGRIPNALFNLK
ncbi:hypothetical protein IFM89_003632 [Coptis chinensis]|uniref:Uncharacterized protein n=1 Tax=Coptis chinensis TaxID=261450 RepID=A0A835LCK1_9MAGN|nr:hypothetical protein IFM89_003632 [Coptis chinensis]